MKSILFSALFTFIFIANGFSQKPDWDWGKTIHGIGYGSLKGLCTTVDFKGNIFAVGSFSKPKIILGTDTISSPHQFNSMLLVKYDRQGNYKWSRHASSYINANVTGVKMRADNVGNILIAGYFNGDSMLIGNVKLTNLNYSYHEIFIAKYDTAGILLWAKAIHGNYEDYLAGMDIDSSGNIYIAGDFQSSVLNIGSLQLANPYIQNSSTFFIAKLDASGNAVWAKKVGPSSWPGYVTAKDLSVDEVGNIYTAGLFTYDSLKFENFTIRNPAKQYFAKFFVKYDPTGHVKWAKCAPDSSNIGWRSLNVLCDKNKHVYLSGQFQNSFIAFSGDTLRRVGGENMFIFQFDTAGQVNWSRRNGVNNVDVIHSSAVDSLSNFYITGEFDNILYFGSDTLDPSLSRFFVVKFDVNGSPLWAQSAKSGYFCSGNGITINKAGNAIITGYYYGATMIFGKDTLMNPVNYNYFISQLSFITVSPRKASICIGDSILLNSRGATSYLWIPGSGLSSVTDSSVVASPPVTTTYEVKGTIDGFTSRGSVVIQVNPKPGIPFINLMNDSVLNTNSFSSANQWFRNDTLIPGAYFSQYLIPQPVLYQQCFKLRKTNNYGCMAFSDTLCVSVVGINENFSEKDLEIYPNPSSDFVTITFADNTSETSLNIYNSMGEMVYYQTFTGKNLKVIFEGNPGLYLFQLRQQNKIMSRNIIKE